MPEEINRIVTDALADWLFTPSPTRTTNLAREGVGPIAIHLVGNVMIDTLLASRDAGASVDASGRPRARRHALRPGHAAPAGERRRPAALRASAGARCATIGRELPARVPGPPAHAQAGSPMPASRSARGSALIEPLGYLDFLALRGGRALVLTDSGGIQEETTVLGVPCLTLRENTERPITICDGGTNQLVGFDRRRIRAAVATKRNRLPTNRRQPPCGTATRLTGSRASSRKARPMFVGEVVQAHSSTNSHLRPCSGSHPSGPRHDLMNAILIAIGVVALLPGASTALHLGVLGLASLLYRDPKPSGETPSVSFIVLVPAHNEELVIRATLDALVSDMRARDQLLVVADRCTDATAAIARAAGALVLERSEHEEPGEPPGAPGGDRLLAGTSLGRNGDGRRRLDRGAGILRRVRTSARRGRAKRYRHGARRKSARVFSTASTWPRSRSRASSCHAGGIGSACSFGSAAREWCCDDRS